MNIIARIRTDFPTKFGIPRQSGLIEELKGQIIMEPEYRTPEAFRGLDGFSHIWLLWQFSQAKRDNWSATVKPPRLGGKKRMGVFATRSPFRPNDIGLSCVKLEKITADPEYGPVLLVAGVDLMDQTPIYDIKPYIPFTDSHPEAKEGFARATRDHLLTVDFPVNLQKNLAEDKAKAVLKVLEQDPRPAYDSDPERVYGVEFAGSDVRFTVKGNHLTVCEVIKLEKEAAAGRN